MKYLIVKDLELGAFEKQCNLLLQQGWKLYGDFIVGNTYCLGTVYTYYYQAFTKE